MAQFITLHDDQPVVQTTIADAIDMLRTNSCFGDGDTATIRVGGIRLPSGQTVGLVCVIFEKPSDNKVFVVRLRSANAFKAFERDASEKQVFGIESLNGATVDAKGNTVLTNGRIVRAVEVVPEFLPCELTDLDLRIIHTTISMMGAEDRCYRSLRFGVPEPYREMIPDYRRLDFSTFAPGDDRPPLKIPLLKQIKWEVGVRYPGEATPSVQKISDTLAKVGLRSSGRRPALTP